MMTQILRWMVPILIVLAVLPKDLPAQRRDLVTELSEARRIFVPVEDLDVVVEQDKQGVVLPRAKFDVMLTQARANAEKNAVPAGIAVVLTNADYAARIVGDQLLISVTAELTQFEDDWRETKLPLQRLALEQALVDDAPALIGRHADGTVSLITDTRGKHTVKLQLSTELTSLGSDQVAAFPLLGAPSGSLTLSLPAGKRLLIGNLQLERPAPLDQVADYSIAVGGVRGIQLRITDRAAENAADSLTFATTGYGLHVAPGEVTWHALTTLQVFGKPVDRLSFSIPRMLEIADVESTGLEGWELSDDPDDAQRTNISLTFGQAFEGARKISFKGVMAVETGEPWFVPPLRIASVTSHIGQVVVQYPAGVRLRIEATAGVRRTTQEQKPAADMPDDLSKLNASESLRFDVWQPDFLLQLTTQPKEREVQAAIAAVLDVNATGLDLQAALTVETHFAPLFELDVRISAEWQVVSAQRDGQPLKWQMVGLDEAGVNQLRILLDPPIASGTSGQIRLALRRDMEGWPVEAEPISVNLPELYLPQSGLSEGALVVRGDEDLDLEAFDLRGLDPQPLKADFERLRFQSQDTRFAGKLKITRKPSRIAVQTVTFGRIDPQTFHTLIQSVVEVQGGGVRTLAVSLPEGTGTALRFQCSGRRIVEQKPAEVKNGERVWTLQFDQRLRGQALIVCDIEVPRADAKEFIVPQCRFGEAERQNGYLAVEAGGEQRLTIVAVDAEGVPLSEVDPLELPNVFYQPKERIVSVLRSSAPGAVLTLSEEKFEKLAVPTAISPLLEISTILGGTGELQHRAAFRLNVVGVQGLHVTLPSGSTLWATLVDGRPVEVRRNGDVYLVPLTAVQTATRPRSAGGSVVSADRTLQLFYRSEVAASQFGSLTQNPPTLTVESGQRTALPVEVLEQKWELYYPEQTRLIDSHSPLEPQQPLDRTSLLASWNSDLRIPSLVDLGGQLLLVLVTIGILAVLVYGYRRKRLLVTQLVLGLIVFGLGSVLLLPAVQQSKEASRRTQARNELKQLELAREQAASDNFTRMQRSNRAAAEAVISESTGKKAGMAAPVTAPAMQVDITEWRDESKQEKGIPSEPSAPMNGKLGDMASGPGSGAGAASSTLADSLVAETDSPLPANQANEEGQIPPPEQQLGLEVRQTQTLGESDGRRNLALLSLAIDFVPPAGSREKTFHYVGADTSVNGIPLEVDYVDRQSGSGLRVFVMALVAMVGWFIRKAGLSTKVGFATLGIMLPLALLPLAPMYWQSILDGVCFGALGAIGLWLVRGCVECCTSCCKAWLRFNTSTVALTLAIIFVFQRSSIADENQPPATATPAGQSKPTTTLIVPFDAGTEPLASERVFLSHEQFIELYRLANPDKVSKQRAPQAGGIVEALYAAKLITNAERSEESIVEVTARYAVKSFVDGQLIVELPVGAVAAREAKLDGQTAALIAAPGCFKVAVSTPGLHVIDFVFNVPARLSGSTGSFTLPLLPVAAGKLAFQLPGKDLSLRVNGSSTIFRRVTQDETQSVEFPVDNGGNIAVSWQPQQAQGAAAAVVHVDSVEAVTLTDAGTTVSHGFAYRIRQGGIADTSFLLPETLRLQAVSGPDVGGWEIQGEGAARKLRVIFRRNVTDQTRVTIETFLDAKVGTESMTVTVPQLAPQEVTNEIGQVAIFAGNQFSLRAEQVESLTQIDGDKFATPIPVSRPNVAPQLAYRFSKRPFTLNLRVTRQESQAHVTSQQAAFVTLRKQQLTTRLRYNLTGAPRSSVSVSLPTNFVLLDVQATGLRDYYVTKEDDEQTLTIELKAPRLGLMEVVIGGFAPREITNSSITFPQPLDATRLESTAAVWLDEGFLGTLETFDGWRSVDTSIVAGELASIRPKQPVQFAFSSTNTTPSPITLSLTQSTPRVSANGLSMVTVTDVAVIYMLALQWQIDSAKTDTLTLTTPNWLAGKLEFQGQGIREATHVDAGNNRSRWTIHLRSPLSGKYFATATATLPPATTEVAAPSLVFETEEKPLDSQRQYVLLINSSLGQLSNVAPLLVESVQREDLPVVVGKEFVDQATELVRVKALLTAPKWSLHKFAQQASAPASVNVADLTTVISRDGTYRAQGLYTIKNRSRQFLALRMPEGTELLSVFVAGQPARAVTTKLPSLKGASAQLIALPKTSAASLSFPVTIVWRGRLTGPLPKSARLTREEFSVPAPQILSQQEDADYGIPVARTRWTVYLPADLDAEASRSTAKHNLSLSHNADNIYGNAVLQEAGELLGFFEQIRESNRRVQSRNNLKQIGVAADNLKQLSTALERYDDRGGDAEFAKNKAEVMKRLSEVEKLATEERKKTVDFLTRTNSPAAQQGLNDYQTDGLTEGIAIAIEQQSAIITSNTFSAATQTQDFDNAFNFSLAVQDGESAPSAKPDDMKQNAKKFDSKPSGNGITGNSSRAQLRDANGINLDELNAAVTNNNSTRQRVPVQQMPGGQQGGQSPYFVNNIDNSGFANFQNGNDGRLVNPNVNNNTLWSSQNSFTVPQLPSSYFLEDDVRYIPVEGRFGAVMPPGNGPMGGGMGGMGGGGMGGGHPGMSGPQPTGQPTANPSQDFGVNPQGVNTNDAFATYPNSAAVPGQPVEQWGFRNQEMAQRRGALDGRIEDRVGGANDSPAWRQSGGLSVGINLPLSGRKLVFTKAGGDPRLALAIRPQESIRWGISLVWSAVWFLVAATVLITLRQASGLRRLVHLLPLVVAVIGVVGFCVLPTPFNAAGFLMFLVSGLVVAWNNRAVTV